MGNIFLVIQNVAYEGSSVVAAYDNRPAAQAHAALCNVREGATDVSYSVDELSVQITFEPHLL